MWQRCPDIPCVDLQRNLLLAAVGGIQGSHVVKMSRFRCVTCHALRDIAVSTALDPGPPKLAGRPRLETFI